MTAGLLGIAAVASPVAAQDEPVDDPVDAEVVVTGDEQPATAESGRVPLVSAPPGCEQVDLPEVVFVGTLTDSDFRTARFEIRQVRAGDAGPFAVGSLVDVRYGLDVQYLATGVDYLVSARRDPVVGLLTSRIREPAPNFGGDDIVGVAEADVDCPELDDPIRTLLPDGSAIETSVLAPLFDQRARLLGAVVVPFAVVFGVLFLLAMFRVGVDGVVRGVSGASRRRHR